MKQKRSPKRHFYVLCILLLASASCKKNPLVPNDGKSGDAKTAVNSVTPVTFNWETIDWMPTPPGQSQIPPPWIGQGSIASTYGIEVVNDHKAADGWILLYNTFNSNAVGSLVNPYFILYNRYKGIMRIYLYTTTQFVYPSTYIVDGISLVSADNKSSLLNFMGSDVVDPEKNQSKYSQIEPAPADGSQPLASNRWYMMQYELAYDPLMATRTSDNIQLSWFTNFNSVSTISLGGTLTGTIKSPVGASGSGISSALSNAGSTIGKAGISLIGQSIIDKNGNSETGANSMGLSNNAFKNIAKGIAGALSSAAGGLPAAGFGLLSAIIGGNSSSPSVNLNIETTISLNGTQTSAGSFPSSPTSLYIPGTVISPTAQNFIPLSNDALGVFNLKAQPKIQVYINQAKDYLTYNYNTTAPENDLFITNPAVINDSPSGATITSYTEEPIILYNEFDQIEDQVVYGKVEKIGNRKVFASIDDLTDSHVSIVVNKKTYWPWQEAAVRVTFTLLPNRYRGDSNSKSHEIKIVKTFVAKLDPVIL